MVQVAGSKLQARLEVLGGKVGHRLQGLLDAGARGEQVEHVRPLGLPGRPGQVGDDVADQAEAEVAVEGED